MSLSVAIDYDKTWSASPKLFNALAKAIRAGGGKVTVLSGNPDAEKDLKKAGITDYDAVVSVDPKHIAAEKQAWLKKNNADLLIDNNKTNCAAAAQVTNAAQFYPRQKATGQTLALALDLALLRSAS